tara:strand:- start:2352 stop:2921 length:570 start_codon:yes stop_codon:yes gene_type:complete
MCDTRDIQYFSQNTCEGAVVNKGNGNFLVKGSVKGAGNPTVLYWAAAPANYRSSFSGSALPFPNPEVAYENTPNVGAVKAPGGNFEFNLHYPNSYYTRLGSVYKSPRVHIKVCREDGTGEVQTILLGTGVPYRLLTFSPPPCDIPPYGPLFYKKRYNGPPRSQEQILKDSQYPSTNKWYKGFWGDKPPK